MKMNGTYGPDSYHIDVSTSASGKNQAAEAMTMSAVMDAQAHRRVHGQGKELSARRPPGAISAR
jgi:hypothetical protein